MTALHFINVTISTVNKKYKIQIGKSFLFLQMNSKIIDDDKIIGADEFFEV